MEYLARGRMKTTQRPRRHSPAQSLGRRHILPCKVPWENKRMKKLSNLRRWKGSMWLMGLISLTIIIITITTITRTITNIQYISTCTTITTITTINHITCMSTNTPSPSLAHHLQLRDMPRRFLLPAPPWTPFCHINGTSLPRTRALLPLKM
mmetsp:Transcript_29134/g.47102  ORF Transcript_29134/g.47102 Transcript_29134/m.47102 type:complete len:152 (+) Transcript_29134:118-573(+)